MDLIQIELERLGKLVEKQNDRIEELEKKCEEYENRIETLEEKVEEKIERYDECIDKIKKSFSEYNLDFYMKSIENLYNITGWKMPDNAYNKLERYCPPIFIDAVQNIHQIGIRNLKVMYDDNNIVEFSYDYEANKNCKIIYNKGIFNSLEFWRLQHFESNGSTIITYHENLCKWNYHGEKSVGSIHFGYHRSSDTLKDEIEDLIKNNGPRIKN